MDLLATLGYTQFGFFLGGILYNILAARADIGLKRLEEILSAKVNNGQLPANHDLRQAVTDALRQALHGLVLALASSQQPGSPFLAELRRQLKHPEVRTPTVLTALLHVPLWTGVDSAERAWINALAKLIDDDTALARLAARSLPVASVDALLDETPPTSRGEHLQLAVAQWIAVELADQPGQPPLLDEYLREGWPLDADGQRISLYTTWCRYFRETVKDRPKVFNIYVAETLAELKQQLSLAHPDLKPALARLPAPALDDFRASLATGFAELKTYLDARFDDMGQRLDAIRVTQTAHTGLLHDIRELIGGFPGLWQSSRRWRYGLIGFAALVLGGGVFIIYQIQQTPSETAAAVQHSFDAKAVAERLRQEIEDRFARDKAQAEREGKHWEAIRELETNRDSALARVDDVITSIREGLAGNPDPIFKEASRILEKEGSDATLAYLESHKADLLARADRAAAQADAAKTKLKQDLQPLLLQVDLLETRQDWPAALALLQTVADKAPEWWEARRRVGKLLRELARFAEAETHLRAALALAIDEKDQAVAGNELAQLLQDTNRFMEAESLMRRVLAIDEKSYGPGDTNVARDLNNLAWLLQDSNRLGEAEPLQRKALAIDEKALGPDDPNVAHELSNLALLLLNTNRLDEAEPLMWRVLEISEKNFGPEHPEVTNALGNLAGLMWKTNRLTKAEPLLRRALAIDEKSYGPGHPHVAIDLNNLAVLLQDTSRPAEAEPLLRRALAIDEKNFGPKHPNVAIRLSNLGKVLQDTNRLTEAEPLMRRAVDILEKSYVEGHPRLATALNNLAMLLSDTNRLSEAEPLLRRALAIDEKSYGPTHPDIAKDLNNLVTLMFATHRIVEAEPLMRRAVVILLKFTLTNSYQHPKLRNAITGYQILLEAQHLPKTKIQTRLAEAAAEAGYDAAEWADMQAGWAQVRVAGVVPGSQAEGLGLQPGDVITRYAGEKLTSNARLIELTSQIKTPSIPLTILRAGQEITLTAQPGKLGVQLQ